ncbi:MAG TPA: isoamylase [Candidatus Anammoximicrobium sp.]|nr:isoamylase [Candidatus Anammoximicrobium sp.]
MKRWESLEGSPIPLGASWVEAESAYNFAIYSKHAEKVTLVFFGDDLVKPIYRYEFEHLRNKTGPIWHCRIPQALLVGAQFYAYQIDGPKPGAGFEWHTFDPEKLLLDPYARDVYFSPEFDREAARRPGSNWGRAPLSVLDSREPPFCWEHEPPLRHQSDLVIYEMHVRGFTHRENSNVASQRRGTFAGVIDKIPYLQQLGVTAVELMPVFQFDPQEDNYWGYMPLSFFAPHDAYCVDSESRHQHLEFCEMVQALHRAGIEIILDVVYNHTCEGDQRGPTYSFKGIDSTTYYLLTGDPKAPFANYSGTGNTLHTSNRAVRQLILDSLRYWTKDLHVDGFRFDLASIFLRNADGSINTEDPALFGQIAADPDFADVRLIAEPWDAAGAYQLGRLFPGFRWMQWNGAYRDALQKFVKSDPGMVADLMTRLYGSNDLFTDERRYALRPFQSINYITSHDGFTLYDLVSYGHKQNWANGQDNLDGHDDFSWNCGWEGDHDAPEAVLKLRRRQVRNFFALLMLSAGVPMFRMGDEFLQTQGGNSNPYNQDNETSWLDWSRLDQNPDIFRFFQRMIAFRKAHPSLARSRFWRNDVRWYGVGRPPDLSWNSRSLAFCLHGAAVDDADIYVMINAYWEPLEFGIHEGLPGNWRRVVDTSLPSPEDIVPEDQAPAVRSRSYRVPGRSVAVLVRQ